MGTVIDNLRWTHRSAGLSVVEAYTVTATSDEVGVDTIVAESVDGNLANLVLRELRDEVSLVAVVGQAHSHVSLTTARDDAESGALDETVIALGREAKHDFAKCYDFCHGIFLLFIVFDLLLSYLNLK